MCPPQNGADAPSGIQYTGSTANLHHAKWHERKKMLVISTAAMYNSIMKTYTLFQKILAIGDTYEVRQGEAKDAVFTIKGKVLTFSPSLTLMRGDKDGEKTHQMKGNFIKTKFAITTTSGGEVGAITFPFFVWKPTFTLTMKGNSYTATGTLFAWNFTCTDSAGKTIFTIQKEFAFRDKFTVSIDESLEQEVALLAAVAIDQRYFQKK
jgi:uncharacterized protein YxjI